MYDHLILPIAFYYKIVVDHQRIYTFDAFFVVLDEILLMRVYFECLHAYVCHVLSTYVCVLDMFDVNDGLHRWSMSFRQLGLLIITLK
jgi:hypothetical protein